MMKRLDFCELPIIGMVKCPKTGIFVTVDNRCRRCGAYLGTEHTGGRILCGVSKPVPVACVK